LYDLSQHRRSSPRKDVKASTGERVPTYLVGDLDSVRNEVLSYYKDSGTEVIRKESVNSNDFHKSMKVALSARKHKDRPIFVLGGYGGRIDQTLGNLNVLYNGAQDGEEMYWISGTNLTLALSAGRHHLYIDPSSEGPTCGLIPIGWPVREVTTEGLKWNLDRQGLSFGREGLISTSNAIQEQTVVVETSDPLLWTCELHLPFARGSLDT